MKLKQGFITHNMGGEQVMVGTGAVSFSGLVKSNETAAFIVDQLKKETSKEAFVDAMLKEYDAPRKVIERDVERILQTLRGINALEE